MLEPFVILVAVAVLAIVGRVVIKAYAAPGFDTTVITLEEDIVIDEANVKATATFNTADADWDANFDGATLQVWPTARKKTASGGAAAADIKRVEWLTRTATSVTVEVELTAAPGAGETRTITVCALISGKVKK